jgi:hypothetical protein
MRQTILSIILIVVILTTGFVWYRYIRQSAAGTPSQSQQSITDERLRQYRQLKNFNPDTSILSDPLFQSLHGSASASSSPPATGRQNPFAPL